MKLHEAFNITQGDVVAFIGAGGKTAALVALGHELAEMDWRVLATATTPMPESQLELMPHAMPTDSGSEAISDALTTDGFVFLYNDIRKGIVYGPPPEWITRLMDAIDSDVILIEADNADGLPLKAPYPNEPIIPAETSLVVPIASLSVLGEPLDDHHVYNTAAIIDRYGFAEGSRVKSPWVAQVIRDEELGLQGIPEKARIIALLNQVSSKGYGRARARLVAQLALRKSRLNGVAIGSVRGSDPIHEVQRSIGAVVLAAGMSSRMGEPKQLLPWADGKTIIEHIIEQLLNARLEHVVVVTGHMSKTVKGLAEPMGVKVAYNRSYKTGEMLSSLKAGLRAMPDHVTAALLVLGDQPRIQPKVIYQLMMAYAEGTHEIIAPSYNMRRGHPILISRRYWPEILNLPRSASPRDFINAHQEQIHYVTVNTDSVLRDVDTPEDYDNERWQAGLT